MPIMQTDRVQQIQMALRVQSDLASHLEKTIVNKDAKEFLLRFALNSLSDIDTYLLPQALKADTPAGTSIWLQGAELMLSSATKQLQRAQEMVAKYGANIVLIGG
jgi:hypothetical protein